MPPRFAYWTIIVDGAPSSFRTREREELLPTFHQLRKKSPDAVIKWFSDGRLWESPEEAREIRSQESADRIRKIRELGELEWKKAIDELREKRGVVGSPGPLGPGERPGDDAVSSRRSPQGEGGSPAPSPRLSSPHTRSGLADSGSGPGKPADADAAWRAAIAELREKRLASGRSSGPGTGPGHDTVPSRRSPRGEGGSPAPSRRLSSPHTRSGQAGPGAGAGKPKPGPEKPPRRGKDWRPGGDHKDPRDKYKGAPGERRKKWKAKFFEKKRAAETGGGAKPPRRKRD